MVVTPLSHGVTSFNHKKGDYHDFSHFNQEMLKYCYTDTAVTMETYDYLQEEGKKFSDESYDLERKVRSIVDKQQSNGFAFDLMRGMTLEAKLMDELYSLEEKAHDMFPPTIVELKTKTKEIPFNIASRKQIAERLMKKGWKPKKKTDKGNVIVNEAVLDTIDMPEAKMFSRYFLLQKRTGLLKAWIQACSEQERVHGRVLTLKTITGRMAHHGPNMAQVPAVYSPYGKGVQRTLDSI